MEKRYIKIGHELVAVNEEVYKEYTRWKENLRYLARRDGKCGQSDYSRCSGDCLTCRWYQEGYRMLSLHKVLGEQFENETPNLGSTAPSMEDIIADRLLLEDLYRQLDQVIPNGAMVFKMRAQNHSQRQIAQALGGIAQTTLNHRIKKMDDYIRAHRAELEDLLQSPPARRAHLLFAFQPFDKRNDAQHTKRKHDAPEEARLLHCKI